MKALQYSFSLGPFSGTADFHPYRWGFGLSFHYWPCLYAPRVCVYLGFVKLGMHIVLKERSGK
jgi:hypothetical protein